MTTLLNPITLDALRQTVHAALHKHVADEYLIVKVLGRGASGMVYKTRRVSDEKIFALKEINTKRMSEKVLAEAEAEAELLRRLKWPTVVSLVDSWRSEADRIVYLLMPILDGGNLEERVQAAEESKQQLPLGQTAEWYAQALHGLVYLHSQGVLHRDLKPANLFLAADGRHLRIGDLGSAAQLPGPGPHPARDKGVESSPATPWYAGPEVKERRLYFAASDLYSLGASFADVLALRSGFIAQGLQSDGEGDEDDDESSSDSHIIDIGTAGAATKMAPEAIAALIVAEVSKVPVAPMTSRPSSPWKSEQSRVTGSDSEAPGAATLAPGWANVEEASAEVAPLLHWDPQKRPTAASLCGRAEVLLRLEPVFLETGAFADDMLLKAHMREFERLRSTSEAISAPRVPPLALKAAGL